MYAIYDLRLRIRITDRPNPSTIDPEPTMYTFDQHEGERSEVRGRTRWLDSQSKAMGKSYTRVYVIERGFAIYIAIGVVIIVKRPRCIRLKERV